MTPVIVAAVLLLAAANGANDVSKGVATLAGSGVTRYRTAIAWGAGTTLVGAVASAWLGAGLLKLFSSGIVAARPTPAFALAVLLGAGTWVGAATRWRLPMSSTHAIVGALIGAGLLLDPRAVRWPALLGKVALPLLLSAVVAFAISALLGVLARAARRQVAPVQPAPEPVYGGTTSAATAARLATATTAAHWLSAGAVSAARGLNDTPKLAAVGAVALVPVGMSSREITLLIGGAMGSAALLAGGRVARRLGEDVVALSHDEGPRANLTTAVLVGAGAAYALPMSTTHVATGAIAGTSAQNVRRLNLGTLRAFALVWTVTPLAAGLVAAAALAVLR